MRRLFPLAFVALALAPGTWLRSDVDESAPVIIAIEQVEGAKEAENAAWRREGIWHYRSDHALFGGFSALLALGDGQLVAFSDRGARWTFDEPDRSDREYSLVLQETTPQWLGELWDIEAATRDPATGAYWLAYENHHAIARFTQAGGLEGVRDLEGDVDWSNNAGAEAMVRLADGRFVLLPEGKSEGQIYSADPLRGGQPARFDFRSPAKGFAAVDMQQLPDGRLLVLLRDLKWSWGANWPPFASLLAIGEPPRAGEIWSPSLTLDLGELAPPENYEGLGLRAEEDGRIAVWLIADDNLAALQRTLVVKLSFDPARQPASIGADQAKQKARETARTP